MSPNERQSFRVMDGNRFQTLQEQPWDVATVSLVLTHATVHHKISYNPTTIQSDHTNIIIIIIMLIMEEIIKQVVNNSNVYIAETARKCMDVP